MEGEWGTRNAERGTGKQAHAKDFFVCFVSFVVPSHWNAECGTANAEGKSKSRLLLVEGEAALEHGEASIYHLGIVQPAFVLLDLIERCV